MIKTVDINPKIKIACKFIGEPSSSEYLVVFLHEGMGCIERFKAFPEKMCEKLGLPGLVFDRYGYGYSTALQEERPVDYLHTEAEKSFPLLLEKLSLNNKKLILIGHSDGASIALIYAALFPEKVKALISIAAHVFVEEISCIGARELEKKYFNSESMRRKLRAYHFDHTESTLLAFTRTIPSEAFASFNIEGLLSSITAPVFVIQGKDDHYGTEKQVQSIISHTKNPLNKFLFIEKCGHSPHITHTEFMVSECDAYIKTVLSKQIA